MTQELWATQSGSFSAELTRRAVFAAYARTAADRPGIIAGGLISPSDLQLSAPASGMTVNLAVGEAMVGGSEGGSQGGYYFRNSATLSLAIAAANATNPRIDTVCVSAGDSGYTEPSDVPAGTNGGVPAVITGSPTTGASLANLSGAAALPLSSLLLGYVLVPAAATNIVTANISNKASVAGLLSDPAGSLLAYAGSSAPSGYLACDGSTVSRATYQALFNAIGTTWGAGDGSTTFAVPDFRGRAPIGAGTGAPAGTLTNRVLGTSGGEEAHILGNGEIPVQVGSQGGAGASGYLIGSQVPPAGHNNMQPWSAVLWCIRT